MRAADCNGDLVAASHVATTSSTATLSGIITNETGFAVDVSTLAPTVSAFDSNGDHVSLYGSFGTPQPYGGPGVHIVLKPGGTLRYRSLIVTMQSPDRRWDGSDGWRPVAEFADFSVINFCQQREVPSVQTVN